jgi:N6-adenosine-specific RNA methylase IME4
VTEFAELSPPYSTIVADPPWHYDGYASTSGAVGTRFGPTEQRSMPYSTMTVAEIASLPVGDLAASDAFAFLWTTNAYLNAAFGVLDSWGFAYRQTLVWHKTGNPTPFGGTIAPNHAEYLLLGARGRPPVLGRVASSVIAAHKPQRHSVKPGLFLDIVERVSPGPYVELFCRRPRLGWDSWGHGYEIGASA